MGRRGKPPPACVHASYSDVTCHSVGTDTVVGRASCSLVKKKGGEGTLHS